MEWARRKPDSQWFCLIGAIGDNDEALFRIGSGPAEYIAQRTGEFCPFANDLDRMYENNNGSIQVKITRLT